MLASKKKLALLMVHKLRPIAVKQATDQAPVKRVSQSCLIGIAKNWSNREPPSPHGCQPLNLPWIFCLSKKETLRNEESQLGHSQLRFFGKILLKLTQNSKSVIEVRMRQKNSIVCLFEA